MPTALASAPCGSTTSASTSAGILTAVDKAITGTPVPYIPPTGVVAVIGSVAALATATVMASLRAVTERRG